MPYTMFYDRFPDIAARETRNLIVVDDLDLPPDTYALTELYCDEPGCDCRRVMFNVFADGRKEFVAVIAYGSEGEEYYQLFRKTVDGKHYVAMTRMPSKKVGRNDPCPCGSGRKYKHCCMSSHPNS